MKQKKQYIIIFILLCVVIIPNIYAALTDGLVAYYSFDIDGSSFNNINNLTRFNASTNSTIKLIGNSTSITANTQYWEVNPTNSTMPGMNGNNNMTFCQWIYHAATPSSDHTIFFGQSAVNAGFAVARIYNLTKIGVEIYGGGLSGNSFSLSNSQWYQLCTVHHTNNTIFVYKNGVKYVLSGGSSWNINPSHLTFFRYDGDTANSLIGNLDEVGFWNRSLTDSEITQLYNDGVGVTYPFVNVFTVYSNYNSTNITDFCLTITNITYNSTNCTTNGTITNSILGTYNLSINNISSGIYKEINIVDYNFTTFKNYRLNTYLLTQNNTYITTVFNRASTMKSFIVNASYTNTTNITDFSIDVSCNGGTQYAYNVTLGTQTNCAIEGQYLQYRVTFYPNSTNQPTITQINISMFDDLVSTGGGSGGGGGGSPYVNPYSNLPQVQNGFNVQTLIKYTLYPVEFFSIDAYAWMMPYNTYFFIIKEGRLTGFALWVIVALVLFIMTRKY